MKTPGVTRHGLLKIERISSWTQSAISIPHNFTATRPSRRPCAYPPDTIWEGGRVVSNDLAGQARQALINLQACLREANADLDHVVRWSILIKDGAPLYEGFAAFVEIWGQRPNPPALTVAMVNGFAVTGALCEIEALAAVPST